MNTFSSLITILSVEKEDRKSKKTGDAYQHFAARCMLLNDDGSVNTVGALRTRDEELQKQCTPGTFRADFALQVPDYGQNKGDIVAVLTKLTPVSMTPRGAVAPGATGTAAAPAAAAPQAATK